MRTCSVRSCRTAPWSSKVPTRCLRSVRCQASKGFGKTSQKRVETDVGGYTRPELSKKLQKELGVAQSPSAAEAAPLDTAWKLIGLESEMFADGRTVRAIDLGVKALAVYRHKGKLYCSDANSTAYKYPLIDAKVTDGVDGRPLVEVPLDGTQYDLETGKVLVWCPSSSPVRSVLGALKKDTPQVDLKVYPIQVVKNKVYVRLVSA